MVNRSVCPGSPFWQSETFVTTPRSTQLDWPAQSPSWVQTYPSCTLFRTGARWGSKSMHTSHMQFPEHSSRSMLKVMLVQAAWVVH